MQNDIGMLFRVEIHRIIYKLIYDCAKLHIIIYIVTLKCL